MTSKEVTNGQFLEHIRIFFAFSTCEKVTDMTKKTNYLLFISLLGLSLKEQPLRTHVQVPGMSLIPGGNFISFEMLLLPKESVTISRVLW